MKYKQYTEENSNCTVEELPTLLQWVKPQSRVLEFGPAMGYMTKRLKEVLDCRVVCVELSDEMAKNVAPFAEKVIIANLDEDQWINEMEGSFDYILFGDVLEHLRDPDTTIRRAVSLLNNGGSILTSIPNIAHNAIILSLIDGEFDYQEYGLLDSTHIHFFTRKGIFEMMRSNGLSPVKEKNVLGNPCHCQPRKFYCTHPFQSLFLIGRKDAHVYQFVHEWKISSSSTNGELKAKRLSFKKIIIAILDDLNEYYYIRTGKKLQLPMWLKKQVRSKYQS